MTYTIASSQIKTGDNPGVLDPSAILQAESTTKGVLIPKMTTAQMNAISSPADGLMIYNTTASCIFVYRNSAWASMCDPANLNAWGLTGNAGTTAGTNFLGTTDNQSLVFKTNGTERARLSTAGNLGLGTTTPAYKLDIDANTGGTGNPLRLQGLQAGATSDSILTSASGVVRRVAFGDLLSNTITANNGLTLSGNNVRLGGTLNQATTIAQAGFNMSFTGTGSVGIGTSSPGEKLEVAGNVYVNNENSGFIVDGGGLKRVGLMKYASREGGIWRTSTQDFEIGRVTGTLNSPSAFAVDAYFGSTGFLGLNTVAPAYRLDIDANTGGTGNPLRLQGLQAGAASDSILTASAGVVRRMSIAGLLSGNAITSLNGLTNSVQTLATGTSGTDFNIASSGSTHTFNIPDASATARGVVTTGTQAFAGTKTFSGSVGVGTASPASKFEVNGSFATAFTSKTASYTATVDDHIIAVDATSGTATITLPTAVGITGRQYVIKKVDNSSNNVVLATTSAQTIDGEASVTLSIQWQTKTVVSNGTNWLIINNQ